MNLPDFQIVKDYKIGDFNAFLVRGTKYQAEKFGESDMIKYYERNGVVTIMDENK